MNLLKPILLSSFIVVAVTGCKVKDPAEDVTEVKTTAHSRSRGNAVTKIDIITDPPLEPAQIPGRGDEGASTECWWDITGDMRFEYTYTEKEGGGLFSSPKAVEKTGTGLRGGDKPTRMIKMETAHLTGYASEQPPMDIIRAMQAVGEAQPKGEQPPLDAINTIRQNQEKVREIVQKAQVMQFLTQTQLGRQLANNQAGEYINGVNYFPMSILVTNKGRVFAGWRPLGSGDPTLVIKLGHMDKVGTFIKDPGTIIEFVQTDRSAGLVSVIPNTNDSWLKVQMRICPEGFSDPKPGQVLPGDF